MQDEKTLFLNAALPKVGIRPVIDGRRDGVRESLESVTMDMAEGLKVFLESNLKYPTGESVQCVIADTAIGGVSEAARCAEKFSRESVGLTITVTPCWGYGSETIDMDPLMPKAIWGFNGTERPGAVYLAAALAAHNQKGLPAFGIYGRDVQDAGDKDIPDDVASKILQFTKSGLATALMKGKSYLSIGNVSMGIAGSIANSDFFESYLGMRNEYVDMSELTRRISEEIYDKEEYENAMVWVKENCKEGIDYNSQDDRVTAEQKEKEWGRSVKIALICRDLMVGNSNLGKIGYKEEAEGHNAIVAGFQGQRQWTDYFANGDFMEAILNSSFDWSGIRKPYIMATENDSLNGVAMLFGYLLTNTAQVFADVRTYWSPKAVKRVTGENLEGVASNGVIHLINSGSAALDGSGMQTKDGKPAIKPFWEITPEEVKKCLDATTWGPAIREYFRGGGFSSKFVTRGDMPITLSRINIIKGLGPVLQIAEGYTVELPEKAHKLLDERTNPSWPTTWFAPVLTGKGAFTDVYSVMNNWGANHGAFCYGHVGSDLITLASILRIPVCMHNVPAERIFRPSVWNSFGTDALEGADYRACNNLGPVYGRK